MAPKAAIFALASAGAALAESAGGLSIAARAVADAAAVLVEGGESDSSSDNTQRAQQSPGVWISADSPEWPVWDSYLRSIGEKSKPRDLRNGWFFPSLEPPEKLDPSSPEPRRADASPLRNPQQ